MPAGIVASWASRALSSPMTTIRMIPSCPPWIAPTRTGSEHHELVAVLARLLASARCVGPHVTVIGPDLDIDGRLAAELTDTLVAAIQSAFATRPGR